MTLSCLVLIEQRKHKSDVTAIETVADCLHCSVVFSSSGRHRLLGNGDVTFGACISEVGRRFGKFNWVGSWLRMQMPGDLRFPPGPAFNEGIGLARSLKDGG